MFSWYHPGIGNRLPPSLLFPIKLEYCEGLSLSWCSVCLVVFYTALWSQASCVNLIAKQFNWICLRAVIHYLLGSIKQWCFLLPHYGGLAYISTILKIVDHIFNALRQDKCAFLKNSPFIPQNCTKLAAKKISWLLKYLAFSAIGEL